jgi:hypothetical protein
MPGGYFDNLHNSFQRPGPLVAPAQKENADPQGPPAQPHISKVLSNHLVLLPVSGLVRHPPDMWY